MKFFKDLQGNYLNFEHVIFVFKEKSSYNNLFNVNAVICCSQYPIVIYKDQKENDAALLMDKLMHEMQRE